MNNKRLYIIRPEIEIEYKHRFMRLWITLNYWKYIKLGRCQILTDTTYYLAFPRIYKKEQKQNE